MPLSIGYIASYAKAYAPKGNSYSLYKFPDRMIEAIRKEKPEVIALSYYVWNANLNDLIFNIAKEENPNVLTVGGGPMITNITVNEAGALDFFSQHTDCDIYVYNQGEIGFAALLNQFAYLGGDIQRLKREAVNGCLVNRGSDGVLVGSALDAILDLDKIPSPYLTGLMDEFFKEPLNPLIETNRSCPYRCTFCAFGITTKKFSRFSLERVFAEIDYIGKRCTKSILIRITDANFGILGRDVEIGEHLHKSHVENGFPQNVFVNWNKNRLDRLLKVATALKGLAKIGASVQSLNEEVLTNIKRQNLSLKDIKTISQQLGHNAELTSELILGLPGETAESHIEANRKILDAGCSVCNFNLMLLPGTECNTQETRGKFFTKTGWRLLDNAFGIYDGQKVFEGEEIVLATKTIDVGVLRNFRFFHFLMQFMWSLHWYRELLTLLQYHGLHPVDFIALVVKEFQKDTSTMRSLYNEFEANHALENFKSNSELSTYWEKEEHFHCLKEGSYGKLNYVFTYKILLDCQEEFNSLLLNLVSEIAEERQWEEFDIFINNTTEILRFISEKRISLDGEQRLVDRKRIRFSIDILGWKEQNFSDKHGNMLNITDIEYEFYLPLSKKRILEHQFCQFKSKNNNQTLRMMSVYTDPDQFFYNVRRLEANKS